MLKLSAISKSEFTKNTFILVLGTVVAQLIPLILHPILRRIYSPEDFGAMAVYLNIFSIVSIVSSLRYEAAIVLPKRDNEAMNVLSLSILINIVFSLILFILIFVFNSRIVSVLNFPHKMAFYLYLLPFATSLFGIYQSINYWLIRKKAFKASTSNKIVRRAVEGGFQTFFGFLKIPGGLFIGDFFGNLANVISGFRQIFKNGYEHIFVSPKKLKYVFKKYIEFPKFNVLPTLLSSAATILPFLFINKIFSTEVVGYLDLSRLVLSIPLVFVSATISQVFLQHITEKKHQLKSIRSDVKNIFLVLISVILLEVLIIMFAGPFLFGFVFGDRYTISGEFSQILIFSFILNFIGSAYSSIFIVFGKIKINSIWQTVYFFAICSLVFFRNVDIYTFLKIYVIIEIVMHLSYFIMLAFIVNLYEKNLKSIHK